ncbi:MAG: extracellular solute-binding protein [Clostridiales bacterium]|nr:extracellular solute-binding protein [Clostridiales bacterium]
MKKILCAVLAVLMVLSFAAGCNNGKDPSKSTPKKGESTNSTSSGEVKNDNRDRVDAVGSKYATGIEIFKPTKEQRNVRIMWSVNWDYWQKQHTEENPDFHIVTKRVWEETTGGQAVVEVVAETEQHQYIASAVASGIAPDIIPAIASTYPSWQMTNFTKFFDDADIKDHIELSNTDLWDFPASDEYKWNGHYSWLIPKKTRDPLVIVYNKAKFDLAGEKTPMEYYKEGKWTWTQFKKTARSMTDVKKNEYGYTGFFLKHSYYLPIKRDVKSGDFYVDWNDTRWSKWQTELFDFYQTLPLGPRRDYNSDNYKTLFPGGSDAMTSCYLSDFAAMYAISKESGGDELRIAPIYVLDVLGDKEIIPKEKVWGYCICAAAVNPVGAAEYIRLEALIAKNIEKEQPEFGALDSYLTEDEKKALRYTNELLDKRQIDPKDKIYGIGGSSVINDFLNEVVYGEATKTFQTVIESCKPEIEESVRANNKILQQYMGK